MKQQTELVKKYNIFGPIYNQIRAEVRYVTYLGAPLTRIKFANNLHVHKGIIQDTIDEDN